MHINAESFAQTKSGKKTIERRLYDEKRQHLKVGDDILFTNDETGETLACTITGLCWFRDFATMVANLGYAKCGWDTEPKNPDADMERHWTKPDIKKYGALGIVLEVKK